jgi:hypothetical protein
VLGLTSYDLRDDPAAQPFVDAYLTSKGARHDLGESSVREDVDRWFGDHSSLYRHRSDLRDPAAVLDALRGHQRYDDPVAATFAPTGRPTFGEDFRFEQRTAPGGGDLTGWRIGTRNVAAVRSLIRGARRQGARVVLVNMPVTDEYVARHPRGETDYAEYQRVLQRLADDEHVALVDLRPMKQHQFFADEVHVNGSGSKAETELVVAALRADGFLAGVLR